ncbi:hypothetical protein UVI_02031120 [Ustilaginoidea virens]|uniref:tetrahydrofolate synthase n=1 Tax=Ustilaginoidea virens TaxID=1159556 RepID=A0A1B5L190_USTVR|nr:hypothetical protein UVI_02031120 [Ustilaginoidea virens]
MVVGRTWQRCCCPVPTLLRKRPRASLPPARQSSRLFFSIIAPRDYREALSRLAQLQANRAVTQLFDRPPGAARDQEDLNAAAIPEMAGWLARAGYAPQDLARMRHIHVAGTKGKGSVCAFATSVLRQYADGPVGTYTSPHLVSPRERIAVDGRPVSQDVFARGFFELWDRFTEQAVRRDGADAAAAAAAEARGPATKPFFFRYMTILAWHLFLQQGVGDVVMECGIGGEHDATNVLPAEAVSAAVICRLGRDHVAMLGGSLDQIAWHKAGILKPGVRAFTVNVERSQPSVMRVLRRRAAERSASLVELDPDAVRSWGGVRGGSLRGDFQATNQALAVMAAQHHLGLEPPSLAALPDKMVRGLREAALRGRCEILRRRAATWLLDGAHTAESLDQVARWLARELQPDDRGVVLVFNQQERDAAGLLRHLLAAVGRETGTSGVFRHALFARNERRAQAPPGGRDALSVQRDAAAAMREASPRSQTAVFGNVDDAVHEAERLVAGGGKVLVTGSLHLVGGVLQVLEPDSLL